MSGFYLPYIVDLPLSMATINFPVSSDLSARQARNSFELCHDVIQIVIDKQRMV
jgi:hypothetical protein